MIFRIPWFDQFNRAKQLQFSCKLNQLLNNSSCKVLMEKTQNIPSFWGIRCHQSKLQIFPLHSLKIWLQVSGAKNLPNFSTRVQDANGNAKTRELLNINGRGQLEPFRILYIWILIGESLHTLCRATVCQKVHYTLKPKIRVHQWTVGHLSEHPQTLSAKRVVHNPIDGTNKIIQQMNS